MPVKAAFFDVDGTLIDSVDQHAEAWVETFAHFGTRVSFKDVRAQIGKGGDQLMPVFLSAEFIERHGKEVEAFRGDLFKRAYLKGLKPFAEVRALVERVKRDGLRVVLVSSAKADELGKYAEIAEISDLVDVSVSSADAENSKPSPDIVEAALKKTGVRPSEALMIGDSPYDAEAAIKVGVQSVGVLCGGFAEADLRAAGCGAIYRDPAELLRTYESSPLAG